LKIFFSFFGCYPDLRHMKDFFFTQGDNKTLKFTEINFKST
jgi:hypothetical protein